MLWAAGPVGGLKGFEPREGEELAVGAGVEDEDAVAARGPVGMPPLPPLGPVGGAAVGETDGAPDM